MPVEYLKNSFKKVDERTIEFKIKNMEGSARINVSPSVFLDGKDVTSGSAICIKEGELKEIRKNMDLDILLGESITLRTKLGEPISKGSHTVKVVIKVNWPLWTSFETEFKTVV
jgi:hypothetical protein